MSDKIPDGVCLSCAWRALHQNASVLLKLLCNSDLLRLRGFAQQHFTLCLNGTVRRWIRISGAGDRQFFSNDIQEGPRQIVARAEVRKHAPKRSGESQGARPQEEHRIAPN